MTPSLFDLPVRTSEAAELANLILEIAADKPITDDVRHRIAARSKLIQLPNTIGHFASMERDPIHSSAVYVAIDAIERKPLLLRIAPASTPSSGLFPNAILIGRVRGPKGAEVVINAVPFAKEDRDAVRIFASQINPVFQPRPAGGRPALIVDTNDPEQAFSVFRSVWKERSLNLAGIADANLGAWGAIRSGWREGWVIADGSRTTRITTDDPEEILAASQQILI